MSYPSGEETPRLVERTRGGDAASDRAAVLIRGSFVPRDPDAAELERITRGVAAGVFPHARARLVLRVALAAVCLMAGVASVRGYEMARRAGWLGAPRATPAPKPAPETASKRRVAPKMDVVEAPAVDEIPAPALAPAIGDTHERESPSASPAPAHRPVLRSPTSPSIARAREIARPAQVRPGAEPSTILAPPAQPTPSLSPQAPPALVLQPAALPAVASPSLAARTPAQPLAVSPEVREMDRALGYLRRDRNPGAALAALDSYLGRYPHGVLEKEARLARIDALVLLGRNEQALSVLETITFDPGLRSTELLVVRAELRAAKDCRLAVEDFSVAIARSPDAKLLERILYGRGACRTKLQDLVGADDDLQRYLERFPQGVHADWARRWVASRHLSENKR
jgi:hypothetical protein